MARKHWSEMTFAELDHDAIIEHAESLGGARTLEAIDYLMELSERVEFTAAMKEKERLRLRGKMKRKKDNTIGKLVSSNERLYTDEQIEKILSEKKDAPKHDNFTLKRLYCERYYPALAPKGKKAATITLADKLAAAKARALEGGKK
ncbi:hypothetical protein FACS18949_12080 [Clostridia bacterium]|nr:hypothetical protein FACS18949_12080 [Clostridia bacterium]